MRCNLFSLISYFQVKFHHFDCIIIIPNDRVLLNDLQELSSMEGHDVWRATESRALSDLVQRRLHHLQNPVECSKARKLICNLNKVHNHHN